MSGEMMTAMLAEIAAFYGTGPISRVDIEVPFPFNLTSALQDGIFGFSFGSPNYPPFSQVFLPGVTVDILDQVNAKGGRSENYRRLTSRRSTCTFSSSAQYIQVPAGGPFDGVINSVDDLLDHPEARICTGNLSTQLSGAYFPDNEVFTSRGEDIIDCYQRIVDGDSDIMMSSLPVMPTAAQLGVPGPAAMISVPTNIVAGTPYWVREDDVTCEFVTQFGPWNPFTTFRECREGK
jgi:hypothetical protein